MTAQPTLRRATPDDAAILRLMIGELADHQDEGQYVIVTVDQWRKLLGRDDVVVFLAELDGEAVGYVSALRRLHLWTGGDILGLDDLYVREQYRSTGAGRALMLELARYALPERLTISWGMRLENEGAQRFYARLGANLREKVVASWDADSYSQALTS